MTTITTEVQAKKRLKEINQAAQIFTHAIGIMEVDGWFGRGTPTEGLSQCIVPLKGFGGPDSTYDDAICLDGGAVCAGIAIDVAAQRYAKARRWNKERTYGTAKRHLDLFQELNGRAPGNGLFRGIAGWNDHEVTNYDDMKDGFGTALKELTKEKAAILLKFPKAGTWNLATVVS